MLSSSLGAQTLEMSVAVYCSSSQLLSTSRMGNASRVRPPVPAPTSHTRKPAGQQHRSQMRVARLVPEQHQAAAKRPGWGASCILHAHERQDPHAIVIRLLSKYMSSWG